MQPTYFINHGGRPCFVLDPRPMRDTWNELEAYQGGRADRRQRPDLPHYAWLRGGRGDAVNPAAEAFDAWLRKAMTDGDTRERSLIGWEHAPEARQAQPHEDHLLPLMVAAGAASGEPDRTAFHGHALGKPISGFGFG